MNRVRAAGRQARRVARVEDRLRRGEPARRRTHGAFPSGRLRDGWPSASLHRTVGPGSTRLLGTREPAATTAPRARVPVRARALRPTPFDVRGGLTSAPAVVEPAVVEPAVVEPAVAPPLVLPPPALLLAPPVVDEYPTTTAAAPASPRRPRRTLLLVGAAVVVLAAGGTAVGVVASQSGSSGQDGTSAVAASTADDLVAWLRTNVPSGTSVVTTDAALATALSSRGVDATTVSGITAAPADSVVVAAAGGAADPAPVTVDDDRSLVPLARFTGGSATYGIGQLVDRAAADVIADRAAEQSTARAATTGLLSNAAVDIQAGARPSFAAGTLDLRTAAFLALLAGSQQVRVLSAPQDVSEQSVGLPLRSVVVSVADVAALRAAVELARYPYAPSVSTPTVAASPSDTAIPDGSVLLVWPVIADPALTVT